MQPDTMLDTAAVLLLMLGIAHTYLGEKYLLARLFRRNDLPKLFGGTAFTKGTLRFVWHLVTVAWLGFVAMLLLVARGRLDTHAVLQIIATAAIASALLPLLFTRGRHLSWIVFLLIGGLVFAAL